jgi:hypothetical protein
MHAEKLERVLCACIFDPEINTRAKPYKTFADGNLIQACGH